MPFFETLVPKGVQKDVSARALDKGGNRLALNPMIDALNARYLSSETGDIDVMQNIPGTIGYDPGLPAGTNICINAYDDITNNQVIFFNYNSNSNHGIYSWNPVSKAFKTLIVTPLLAFNPLFRVNGVGVVNDNLYWTDFLNGQGHINMSRDYSAVAYKAEFSLYKKAPNAIRAESSIDTGVTTNSLTKSVYQFAKRYVYLDNEISALSPITAHQSTGSNDTYTQFQKNYVVITDLLEQPIKSRLKSIQFLYQKNNDGNWYVFYEAKTTEYVSFFAFIDLLFLRFYDNKTNEIIAPADAAKIFDAIPKASRALALHRSRLFLTSDTEGYAFDRAGTLESAIGYITQPIGYKEGGKYTFGISYYDENLRTPGVTSTKEVTIPYQTGSPSGTALNSPYVTLTIRGKAPTWAKYWSVVRSKEQFYEEYMQIPVKIMFYVGEGGLKTQAGGDVAIPGTMEKYNNGKIYLKDITTGITNRCKYLHLNCPEQMAFVPTIEHQIRIITNVPTVPSSQGSGGIIAFDGENIVTDNLGIDLWDFINGYTIGATVWIEVFKPKKTVDKALFEIVSILAPVNANGGHNSDGSDDAFYSNPADLPGDTYKYRPDSIVSFSDQFGSYTYAIPSQNKSVFKFRNMKIEGAATTTAYKIEGLVFQGYTEAPSPILVKSKTDSNVRVVSDTYTQVHSEPSLVPDYDRIAPNVGRPLLAINNSVEIKRPTTVRFSDLFIQDSNINGLSSFSALNEYVLPTSRTPITKLISVGNILLAVHQRSLTSLYVDYGIIRDGNGTEVLTKTTGVIGNDNEIEGGFGSYNPESIAALDGMAFGWDVFRGAVWRYTQAGVQPPISDYGMQTYFKLKGEQYLPYRDSLPVIGGIDPYNKEYLITFPDVVSLSGKILSSQPPTVPGDFSASGYFAYNPDVAAANGGNLAAASQHWLIIGWSEGRKWLDDTTLPKAVTWAFNYRANVWTTRYSFVPEAYCTIGKDLVSFSGGKLWLHNKDTDNYNTFYGVKYPRQVRFSVNPAPTKVKGWQALHISADSLAQDNAVDTIAARFYDIEGQESYLRVNEFDKVEGIYYAGLLRDINSTVAAGALALREGNDLRSQVLDVLIEHDGKGICKHGHTNVVFIMSEYSK